MIEDLYVDRLRKEDYAVKPISISIARTLVEKYHYAHSATNTGVYTHGLFRKGNDFWEQNCLGVAWWLPPTKNAAIATYPEGDWKKVLSLTRLVIVPCVPKNACSFLLARSIRLIDKSKWECLVTYADTWQNHNGTIYKANNWEYCGTTAPSPVYSNGSNKMMGRKRGGKNLTTKELEDMGFVNRGSYSKHKYRMILSGTKAI